MKGEGTVITVESRRTVEEIAAALPAAAAKRKFGVLGGYNLTAKLADKGITLGREVRVFDVCSPPHAKRVLDAVAAASAVLPCRISVFGEGEGARIVAVRPVVLAGLFSEPALVPVAEEVDREIAAIIRDAAGEAP